VAVDDAVLLVDDQRVNYAVFAIVFCEGAMLLIADESRVAAPFPQMRGLKVFDSNSDAVHRCHSTSGKLLSNLLLFDTLRLTGAHTHSAGKPVSNLTLWISHLQQRPDLERIIIY
jgi:hypothetical protein